MMKKKILEMPKCFDRDCINGIVIKRKDKELVQKLCEKCQKMEKDLLESPDYDVYIVNGQVVGYELIA